MNRRRYTEEEKARLVAEWEESDESRAAYARRHGVSASRRCGKTPERFAKQAGQVLAAPARGQNPTSGVRTVRRRTTSEARKGKTGDVRLPRVHPLLHQDEIRSL